MGAPRRCAASIATARATCQASEPSSFALPFLGGDHVVRGGDPGDADVLVHAMFLLIDAFVCGGPPHLLILSSRA